MDPVTIAAILQWVGLGQKVFDAGAGAWGRIKAAMAAEGIAADTAQLDAIILDAEQRAERRRAEAEG